MELLWLHHAEIAANSRTDLGVPDALAWWTRLGLSDPTGAKTQVVRRGFSAELVLCLLLFHPPIAHLRSLKQIRYDPIRHQSLLARSIFRDQTILAGSALLAQKMLTVWADRMALCLGVS